MGIEQRPEHLPRHRELHYRGRTSFATFVPLETVIGALFNYWEPSLGLHVPGKLNVVYHSQVDRNSTQGGLNLVVIQDVRHDQNRTRVDWYFGTFRGKHSGQCETEEEAKPFFDQVKHIRSRHHRVAGSELNALIRNAAKLDEPVPLSWR